MGRKRYWVNIVARDTNPDEEWTIWNGFVVAGQIFVLIDAEDTAEEKREKWLKTLAAKLGG